MDKVWIKFLKAYEHEETKLAVDDIIELDESIAKSLISLGFAEATDAPSTEDIAKGIRDSMATAITDTVTKDLQGVMKDVSSRLEKSIPAIAKDHSTDGLNGFESEGDWVDALIKMGRPGGEVDERLIKGTPSGQSTLDMEEGGVLVPEQIESRIWEQALGGDASYLGQTDQRKTSGQSLKIKTVPQTSRKDTYRHAGALAYWDAEADEFTASKLKWGSERLELHKLTALYYATDEEMADASIALGSTFSKNAAEVIAWKMNYAFIWGTGAGQPTGIMNENALIEVPLESGQVSTNQNIRHHNLSKMNSRMHSSLRSKAVWLAHPDLIQAMEFIYFDDDTTTKRPVYLPPANGMSIAQPGYGTLYGRPVVPTEFCMDFGQRGDIIFVNWSQYLTLQKQAQKIRAATSIHVRFLYEETAFRFSFRIDGKSMWPSPIEDLHGSTTRSHIVTLASRSGGGSSSGL